MKPTKRTRAEEQKTINKVLAQCVESQGNHDREIELSNVACIETQLKLVLLQVQCLQTLGRDVPGHSSFDR